MKDICTKNFNHSNIKQWIGGYTHKQTLEFMVYCLELVIDLYTENDNAPKKAIQAAKDCILNPSEKNKNKCRAAADAAAYAVANAVANAAYVAAYADNAAADAADADGAAAYSVANAAAYVAAAAAYVAAAAADAADADGAAAYSVANAAAAAAEKSIKDKIVIYILAHGKVETPEEKEALGAIEQPRMKEVYEKLTESNFDVWDLNELLVNGELFSKTSNGEYVLCSSARPVYMLNQFGMHGVYRKVEKPIEWWDDISEHVGNFSKTFSKVNMNEHGYLEVEASMSKEQWQDFARILLEQESE